MKGLATDFSLLLINLVSYSLSNYFWKLNRSLMKNVAFHYLLFALLLVSGCESVKDEMEDQPNQSAETNRFIDPDQFFSVGQTVYVPAYSQIYYVYGREEGKELSSLSITLSIRNTDVNNPIIIRSVKYYDNDGNLVEERLEQPVELKPMASKQFNILQRDPTGGVGANFLVNWAAEQAVYEPYIETVMIGARGTLGFAFRCPGKVLKEINPENELNNDF
jgi:hypothetical protein